MTETELRELLTDLLLDDENGAEVRSAESFSDAMLMTSNEGLVLRMEDGSEFQLTVVKSK